MEDLRWILLLVGALVIAAVYFSSRFEREDWVREREQFDARKKPAKSKRVKQKSSNASPTKRQKIVRPEAPAVTQQTRKEPQMTNMGSDVETPKDVDSSIAPDTQVSKNDDAEVSAAAPVLDSTSSAAELSKKEPKMEPEPASSPEATSTTQNSPPASVEEKVVSELDVTSSASEIPSEVVLTEEMVSEVVETTSKGGKAMPGLSIRAGIEDEIIGVEIPADLAIAEAELHTELHAKNQQDSTSEADSAEMALPPNIEPLVLALTIMTEDEPFTGAAVQEALEAEGLEHGEMRIFHFFDDSNKDDESDSGNDKALPIFSAASLVEPGYFELDKIDEMEMPGLTLFCQLPGPLSGPQSGEAAFDVMLDKGRGVAVRLHGQLCDEKRNRFTTQAKTHYRDRIATFARELSVARKKVEV